MTEERLKKKETDHARVNREEASAKNNANLEILKLSLTDTYKYQKQKDEENIAYINNTYDNGEISEVARDYLISYYTHTMKKYGEIYYVLESCLGKPEAIYMKDLSTGARIKLFHENGKPVQRSLRCVTPSTAVELEFKDKYGKALYLTMPGVKRVERAVEKIKFGGKYDTAYNYEFRTLKIKYAIKERSFIPEVKEFMISKLDGDKSEKILSLNEKYTEAARYYLKELNGISFKGLPKREAIGISKKLHNLGKLVDIDDSNVIDTLGELSNLAKTAKEMSLVREGIFSGDPLLTRYLSELEDIFAPKGEKLTKDYEEFDTIYSTILRRNREYIAEAAKIRLPHERLKDIYRVTVETRYKDNILNIASQMEQQLNVVEVVDKFKGNKTVGDFVYENDRAGIAVRKNGTSNLLAMSYKDFDSFYKNDKGYRDYKVIYDYKDKDINVDFEVQFKLSILRERDSKTHDIYEELRHKAQKRRDCYDAEEVAVLSRAIDSLRLETRRSYMEAMKEYNMKVIRTAADMEVSLFRDEWTKKLDIPKDDVEVEKICSDRIKDEAKLRYGNKKYPEVERFLTDNLLVSPHNFLSTEDLVRDIKEAKARDNSKKSEIIYSANSLILEDEVATKPNIDNFVKKYEKQILNIYRGELSEELPGGYFEDYDKALKELRSISEETLIDKEESEYLKHAGKERVAENAKTVNNIRYHSIKIR